MNPDKLPTLAMDLWVEKKDTIVKFIGHVK